MKKAFALLPFAALSVVCFTSGAATLLEGEKAPSWRFEDQRGTVFKSEDCIGKVTLINYLGPDEADVNTRFIEHMEIAAKNGVISAGECVSIGIIDCKASWKPDRLIREFASRKVEKYVTAKIKLLFDYSASLRNGWGFDKGSSNIIVLDKNGVCRAVVRGKVPEGRLDDLCQLVQKLQTEPVIAAAAAPPMLACK
jgi:predicted transcriptional regulator